jgi:peptide methionine sulfoxide reductase MsrB
MRQLLSMVCLCLSLVLVGPAAAQNRDIQSVIRDQIDAFQSDDFESAFTYASPDIQRLFGSSKVFGQMVRNGYPMVWRPSALRFLEQRQDESAIWQRVLVRDEKGRSHLLDYQMIPTENGWRINAVQLLPATGPTA